MLVSVPRPEMSRVARMSRVADLGRYLRGHAERVLALRVEVLEAEVVGDVQDEGGRRLRLPGRRLPLVAALRDVLRRSRDRLQLVALQVRRRVDRAAAVHVRRRAEMLRLRQVDGERLEGVDERDAENRRQLRRPRADLRLVAEEWVDAVRRS